MFKVLFPSTTTENAVSAIAPPLKPEFPKKVTLVFGAIFITLDVKYIADPLLSLNSIDLWK